MKGSATKEFVIDLPFPYKKAVLTQARTSRNRQFTFIVEFPDGSRKFVKGPFKDRQPAEDHVRYNEIKRALESKYLHPIECEVREYGSPKVAYLVCQELGTADLNDVEEKETELDGALHVLVYSSNDVVPDPLSVLTEVNEENQAIWIEFMVNYSFRWVFGVGDNAGRNLMLEKSTGRIYSTDEIFLKSSTHEDIWGGKRPARKKFELVRAFAESELLDEVVIEVKRWKGILGKTCHEGGRFSEDVVKRINRFVENPKLVLGLQK
jgi:hypothetical protein